MTLACDMLEVLTQKELLKKNMSIQVLGCIKGMAKSLPESVVFKLWESCSGQLPELSKKPKDCLSVNRSQTGSLWRTCKANSLNYALHGKKDG